MSGEHEIVKHFKAAGPRRDGVPKLLRSRASAALQSLIDTALADGIEVSSGAPLVLTARGRAYNVGIREVTRYAVRQPNRMGPTYTGTGLLEIRLTGPGISQHRKYRDTPRRSLESRLPDLLADLRTALVQDDLNEVRRAAWRSEQEAARAARVDAAQRRHRSNELVRHFEDQAARWNRLSPLRAYLTAMRAHVDELSSEEREGAATWIDWATSYVDRLDPLREPVVMPNVPPLNDWEMR